VHSETIPVLQTIRGSSHNEQNPTPMYDLALAVA